MSWEKVKFEQLYLSPSRNGIYKSADSHGSGIKIVNMGEIFAYSFIGNQEMQRIALTKEEYERFGLQNGDLLFARRSLVETGAGKCSIVIGLNEPTTFESSIIRVRLDQEKCVPLFYQYWMRSHAGRTAIRALVSGTNVKGIRGTELKDIFVDYPDFAVQARIAGILKNYDDLIENNQRQIRLLEEAAQRLYKEWFVDLRFPGYENTPIVDGVPEGWERLPIGELIETIPRTTQILASDYGNEGFIPIIDQSRDFIAGYTDNQSALVDLGKPVIVFGDHTRILKYIQFPFAKGADGTQLIVSNSDKMPQSLFYCSLVGVDLSNYHYARHFKYLKAENILVPTQEIADAFDGFVAPIFTEVQRLRDIMKNAAEARDRLLPKLMNNEMEV